MFSEVVHCSTFQVYPKHHHSTVVGEVISKNSSGKSDPKIPQNYIYPTTRIQVFQQEPISLIHLIPMIKVESR